jgi:hypothetical protein
MLAGLALFAKFDPTNPDATHSFADVELGDVVVGCAACGCAFLGGSWAAAAMGSATQKTTAVSVDETILIGSLLFRSLDQEGGLQPRCPALLIHKYCDGYSGYSG